MRATLLSPFPDDTHWITLGTMETVFASVWYTDNTAGSVEVFWEHVSSGTVYPSRDNPQPANSPRLLFFATDVKKEGPYCVRVKVDGVQEDSHCGVNVKNFGFPPVVTAAKAGANDGGGIPLPPTVVQKTYNDYRVKGSVENIPGAAYIVCMGYEFDPATGDKSPTGGVAGLPAADGTYEVEIRIPHNAGRIYLARVVYYDVNDIPKQKYTLVIGP